MNPYSPSGGAEVLAEYDRRRLCDPHLSPLGERQAELLPEHPHLLDLKFASLSEEGRVRVVTSPMQRAILTSQPLLRAYQLPRALLVADVCEKGGSYVTHKDLAAGTHQNVASPGRSRAELTELYGATHDASECGVDGWWYTPSPGAEDNDAFEARLLRAQSWLENIVRSYASDSNQPDYLVIVSHADFIDAILTKLLRLPAGHAKYVFYASNTSISHVEFEVSATSEEAASARIGVRIRGTNIKPVSVSASELALHHNRTTAQ